MPSISDRLKALGVSVGSQELDSSPPHQSKIFPIEQVLAGEFWQTPSGEVFVVETRYKSESLRGSIKLKPTASLEAIAAYAQAQVVTEMDIEEFAFVDTETTGLGLGAGVYTFMVGIGRFERDHFRLAQFFLREPGEETAQLAAIEKFLAPCKAWVSFNGKAFDIPLLNNRFILNGWPPPLHNAPHIDLLHLARRLWKARLSSRTLGDLEHFILGATRSQQDVPGWMIADLYFDYLQSGDARPLLGVFYHNEMDIVTLAALMAHMADLLANPLSNTVEHGLDMIAVAKLYADLGDLTSATPIYQRGLTMADVQDENYWQALKELSFIYKKLNEINAACELWLKASQNKQIYAHIELAKVYEHRIKDYDLAYNWTQDAIQIITEANYPSFEREQYLPELEYRLNRLERKRQP